MRNDFKNINKRFTDNGIMPLTIQPIVENSVVHGLENMDGNGMIQVEVKRENGLLIITVVDNGIGIDAGRLEYIQNSFNEAEDDSGKRIGLKNVHQRIKIYYGEEYGLRISSKPDQGTRIDMLLPDVG